MTFLADAPLTFLDVAYHAISFLGFALILWVFTRS
jgi:hypothetical protein